ncbi:MAG: hypothetical protein SGARI_004963, partial [Bacillariaceae sp.]
MQGSFPKHLAAVLVPLLQANLIQVEAFALMEERNLNIGAHVPFSLTVWILDPPAFFAVFEQANKASSSYSKQFFGNKAADNSKKSKPKMTLTEAAFSLLEWAQKGQPLEDLIENYGKDCDSSDESDVEEVVDDKASDGSNPEIEEEMPDWAKDVVNQSRTEGEMATPKGMKGVELRPYQREALYWMAKREQEASEESKSHELSLLNELAQAGSTSSATTSNVATAAQAPIHCECGPVIVDSNQISTTPAAFMMDEPVVHHVEDLTSDSSPSELEHPLWEKRYLCNASKTQAISFFVQPFFRKASASPPAPPTPCRGGILADAVVLGKTVMLLSLMQKSKEEKLGGNGFRGTLVVTPLSLLIQWQNQIQSKTSLTHF